MQWPRRYLLGAVLAALGCAFTSPAAAGTPQQPARPAPEDAALKALLDERLRNNGVGLAVGVIDENGRRVVAGGRAGDQAVRPLDGDTIFQIGSLTKPFTTLLLADMVLRGEVGLDDPIQQYLPSGVRIRERGRPITLRDLATHRSGLPSMPDNYDLSAPPDPYEAYTTEQLYDYLRSFEPTRAPGEAGEYSNLGVALLGHLLARRAGMDYERLLSERVLRPLGMTSSAIRPSDEQKTRLASGHDRYLRPVRTWEMRVMPASGSLRSTANDMLRLVGAYLGLPPSPLGPAMALQLEERIETARGWQALGWGVRRDGLVTHSGGKQGFRSAVAFDPARRRGVVVLANARTYDDPMALALHLLTGEPLEPAPPAPARVPIAEVESAVLDRLAGWYCLEGGARIEVARSGGHLLVHTPGSGVSEFFPTAPDAFFLDTGNDELRFELAGPGPARRLIHYPDGRLGSATPGVRMSVSGGRRDCERRRSAGA